jgi:hypothetical protein
VALWRNESIRGMKKVLDIQELVSYIVFWPIGGLVISATDCLAVLLTAIFTFKRGEK